MAEIPTSRDRTILHKLSEGKKATEIGAELRLSNRTIEARIDLLKQVYGVKNTVQLIAKLLRDKVIP